MTKRLLALLLVLCLAVPMFAFAEEIGEADITVEEYTAEAEAAEIEAVPETEEVPEIEDAAETEEAVPEIADAAPVQIESVDATAETEAVENEEEEPVAKGISNVEAFKAEFGLTEEALMTLLDKSLDEINEMSQDKVAYARGILEDATYVCAKATGKCGTNLRYELYGNTLKITGSGKMTNWTAASKVPWYASRYAITSISMSSGVTGIGSYAFFEFDRLKTLTLGTIKTIGKFAFAHCHNMETVTLKGVTTIGDYAFYCMNDYTMTIPKTVTSIGYRAIGYWYSTSTETVRRTDDYVIKGYCGSTAQAYAKANSYSFTAIGHISSFPTSIKLGVGETYRPDLIPEGAKMTNSKSKYASISSSGVVTGKKVGTTTITFKWDCGKKNTMKVTVAKAATKVKLNKSSLWLEPGDTYTLKATLTGYSRQLTWSCDDTSVATVTTSGKVTAKGSGTAKITVKTFNGKKATCTVHVW